MPPINLGGNACAPFALAGDDEGTDRALVASDRIIRPRLVSSPTSRVDQIFTAALVACVRGDAALAREITAPIVRGEVEVEQPHFTPACRVMYGWGDVLTGGPSASLDLAADAIAEIERTPIDVALSMFRSLHAHALLHAGRAEDAAAILRDVAERCEHAGDRWWLPETLRLLALAGDAVGDDPNESHRVLVRARSLADEQGERRLVDRIDATLAGR